MVQRSFINTSFESPLIGNNPQGCTRTIDDSLVSGWTTTEASGIPFNGISPEDCPAAAGYPPNPVTPNVIQLFLQDYRGASGYSETAARSGVQFAELNAQTPGRLYQRVCMVNGEQVTWALSHRARLSGTIPDVMAFNIGPNASGSGSVLIVRGATTATGIEGTTTTPRLCGTTGLTSATCTWTPSNTPTASGWADYSGSFVWNGGDGIQTIGFEAISSTWGLSGGNYLDDITVTLKPYLHFAGTSATYTYTEGGTAPTIQIQVVGVVPSAFTLTLAAGGTATDGSDYTRPAATVTIPAGNFGEGTMVNVPVTFLDDAVIEDNETLTLTIPDSVPSSPYVLANTNACGANPFKQVTINFVDNDIDLLTTKTASTAVPVFGTAFTYTVIYTNNTGKPTIAPTTAHDATAAISDAVPSGLTFTSWTCTGAGGGTCPAASGSGAISGNAALPAGGSITYTVNATLATRTVCSAVTNTSTVTTPSGFAEGTSVQAGFTSPAPGGAANNTASVDVTPRCTDLLISKTNTTASGATDQASDTVTSGNPTTYILRVENKGAAVTGAVIQDTPDTAGLTCPGTAVVTCTGSSASICPSATYTVANLTGSGIVLGNFPSNATATLSFTCTVK